MQKGYMQKKLGVIGGLGTETAAQFYISAERLWHEAGQPNHIPLTIENIQSPFSLEQAITTNSNRIAELKDFLCQAAKSLEAGGASFIVLPCNTAHVHLEAVKASVDIPVLSITQETARKLHRHGIERAAILGTGVTRESGIYDADCQALGIQTLYPSEADQKRVETIIQRTLAWKNDQTDQQQLQEVIAEMKQQGAQAVVLACTDLQLSVSENVKEGIFGSMKTLAEASVRRLVKW